MQASKHQQLNRNNESKLIKVGSINLSAQNDHDTNRPVTSQAQVVIIGAGLAGLAAAQRLHESGIEDVIILDALDRVGGRVYTVSHSDYLLELGAQWLHGADDNPLYQWLTGLNMLDDFQDASLGFQGMFCTSSLAKEINPQLVKKVLDIVCESKLALSKDENYLDHLCDVSTNVSCLNDVLGSPKRRFKNASEVFRCHFEMRLKQDEELGSNKQLANAIFEWFLRYETIENCCDSMQDVSIKSYTDWTDLGDGTLLNFKDGYSSLLRWFCKHFPRDRWLHLNKQVLNVEISNSTTTHNSPVIVKYKSVDNHKLCESNTIACSHVIVTASLGFLKKNLHTFFTPELPSIKQELIKSIGFGTVNKIVLQFERPFWDQSSGVKLVWQEEDFHAGPDSFPAWCRDILAFDVVRRQPNLLIGWIGGQGAKLVENETDENVGKICLRILDKFLPKQHDKPSKLLACFCSRWQSNPFTCGSYSFQSMSSLGMNVDKLQEPLYSPLDGFNDLNNNQSLRIKNNQSAGRIPRVLFAGEATAGKLYSTTHGAIISGWREADRLTDYLSASKLSGNNWVVQSLSNVGGYERIKQFSIQS